MSSSDAFHNRSIVAWLESVMPTPVHIPEGMKEVYGPNPLLHLCPLIAEYLGPNPFYCVPDSSNLQVKEKIKMMTSQKEGLFEQYDSFFYEMRNSPRALIPTPFPRFDPILTHAMEIEGIDIPSTRKNPYQQYLFDLLSKYHKFSIPGSGYMYRYLPPIQQNAIHTYSITGVTKLHDGSLLMLNECNILLWASKYTPPAGRPNLTGPSPLDKAIDIEVERLQKKHQNAKNNQENKGSNSNPSEDNNEDVNDTMIDISALYATIPREEKIAFLLKNRSLGDLSTLRFEDIYDVYLDELAYEKKMNHGRKPNIVPNKQQIETNKSMLSYLIDAQSHTQSTYRRKKINNILPHLEMSPEMVHTFDISTNQWNNDIFLDRLPHQLSSKQLRLWKQRKKQFMLEAINDGLDPRDLSDIFFRENQLLLLDDDQILLDGDGSDDDDYNIAVHSDDDSDDSNDSDDSDDSDDSEYSSSGDNDSSEYSSDDSDDRKGKKNKKSSLVIKKRISCPFGHSPYTAVAAVPPLYHINPADDVLLRNYGISMHSPRLFLTGCSHGHIVLHDGFTGFSRTIGSSKFPIVNITTIATHQHLSELPPEVITQILTNVEQYRYLDNLRNDLPMDGINLLNTKEPKAPSGPTSPLSQPPKENRFVHTAETIYHPINRVFPIVVAIDQSGVVMFWDAISCSLLSSYTQERAEEAMDPEAPPQVSKGPKIPYNLTGMMKMAICAIPLLPHVQRQERFGPQTIRPPAKTLYSTPHATVLSMIFHQYQAKGLDPKTGLPKIDPHRSPIPQFDTSRQPWSPFIGFPFEVASPKLNSGILVQTLDPDEKGFIQPYVNPLTYEPLVDSNNTMYTAMNLLSPVRGTFAAPTVVVTPFRKGQLTFCDLRNITLPTFYTYAHKQHVTCIAYINGLLWTAGWDCTIKSWDLRYLSTPVHTIQGSKKHITAMCGLDDKYLLIADAEKELKIFDIEHLAINRTYSMHVLADCEEYLKSIDLGDFQKELADNDEKLENLKEKYTEYLNNKAKKAKASPKNTSSSSSSPTVKKSKKNVIIDDFDDIDESPSDGHNNTKPNEVLNFNNIYDVLKIPLDQRPKSLPELLQKNPLDNSKFKLLSIYPGLIYTQVFYQWLLQNQLTYMNNRLYPLIASYDLANNCITTNAVNYHANHDFVVPLARNQAQRLEHSLAACLFDWDVDELIQNITVIDGVVFTASKECKAKVGLNKFVGSITPWVTSIDMSDLADITTE